LHNWHKKENWGYNLICNISDYITNGYTFNIPTSQLANPVLSSRKDKVMMHRRCRVQVFDTEAYQCGKFLLSGLDSSIRLVREVLTNYMAIEG